MKQQFRGFMAWHFRHQKGLTAESRSTSLDTADSSARQSGDTSRSKASSRTDLRFENDQGERRRQGPNSSLERGQLSHVRATPGASMVEAGAPRRKQVQVLNANIDS